MKYTFEAPEGGWGFIICVGMALPFIQGLGSIQCFGLLFKDFFEEIGGGTSAISIVSSSFFCALSFAGLLSSSLFQKYGIRRIGLVGGFLYFVGSIAQVFVNSSFQLLIAYGLLQGSAFGIIIPVCYSTFNLYFVKKRVMMMSFAQTLIGIGGMIYPILIQKLFDWYGFRGALLVLAAVNSHAIFGMLVMHPVEWHLRKVEIVDTELQDVNGNIPNDHEGKDENHHMVESARNSIGDPKTYRGLSMDHLNKLTGSRRASSIASLGNWTGPVVVSEFTNQPIKSQKKGKWKALVDFLDLALLKKFVYVNIVLGITFALYSDVAFFTLQPLYLFQLGYSRADTALIIAIGCGCDLVSRIVLAFSAAFVSVPSRFVYLAGAFFTFFLRFVFLKVTDFTAMAIMTGILGFLKTWIHVPLPLVFAEYLPAERFASGYGLFMFLQGNLMFAIGPATGYIRDTTGDYVITFHFLNIFMGLCAFPWLIEIGVNRFKGKKSKELST
ncbi:hypothetical protein ACFFRR_003331 [Megaselia abdita]